MDNTRVAALVLAAGFSTRMKAFKPLLPLGGCSSMLARVVGLWRACGVRDIVVVSGHRAEEVEREAARAGCLCVRNRHPEEGMFSSVRAGLAFCLQNLPCADWLAVHPVDIPLVAQETIAALCARAGTAQKPCLVPVSDGKSGHPPLLARRVWQEIADFSGEGGLRAAMGAFAREEVEVRDSYLDTDLDRPEDYSWARERLARSGEGSPDA